MQKAMLHIGSVQVELRQGFVKVWIDDGIVFVREGEDWEWILKDEHESPAELLENVSSYYAAKDGDEVALLNIKAWSRAREIVPDACGFHEVMQATKALFNSLPIQVEAHFSETMRFSDRDYQDAPQEPDAPTIQVVRFATNFETFKANIA